MATILAELSLERIEKENLLTVFAQVAASGRERVALRDLGGEEWTYGEVDGLANGVARAVHEALGDGVEPVALLTEHDAGHVVSRLGILKAGKFVLSLDRQEPEERRRRLLAQARVRMIVADASNHALAVAMAGKGVQVLNADGIGEAGSPPIPPSEVDRASPCGVLYTTGSTGEPKGVLQTHGNVLWNVRNHSRGAGLQAEDRMTLLARGHFAAASSAMYGALLNGACLLPFDVRREGLREMHGWLVREKITVFHSVPTLFRRFCESLGAGERLPDVRLVKLGGEAVMNYDLRLLHRHFSPGCDLLNGLGMTEANGNICHYRIAHARAADFSVIPVGYAVEGVEIIILEEDGGAVVEGQTGEIAIRSRFLSPGYWRQKGFEERFVESPSGDGRGAFFATGDMGRMEADGCLVHEGRKDRLLKIRGQRVEPAVIEAAMMEHPGVGRCAVSVFGIGSKEKRLAAYYEGTGRGWPEPAEIRAYLDRRIAASHVPTWFVPVEEIPLTSNGKIDYKALPDPSAAGGEGVGRKQTRDGLEMELVRIWERVLKIKRPGVEENFFELGGDSLLAALMLSRVEAKLKVDLPLADFSSEPTVLGLAVLVRRFGKDSSYARLVLLNEGEEGVPYFTLAGAGSDVAASKGGGWNPKGRPVYGAQYRGIDGVERAHDTVEEMAAYLIGEMRRIQPQGPYHLGGGSFGGMVAFEAAQQLRRMGEETALLVLLDTRVHGHAKPREGAGILGYCERALLRLLPVGEQTAISKKYLVGALRQARYRLSVPIMRWRCARQGQPLPKVYRFYDLLNRAVIAKRRYEVKPYDGRVILFRFSEQAPDRLFEVDPTLGWGARCANLEICDLPGGHGDLGKNPQAAERFYGKMNELLSGSEAGRMD